MRNIKLLLAFALTILLTSCERDNVDDWGAANKIKFSFVTAAKSNVDITTRAVSEAAESDVTSLYVFVFQNGKKEEEGYISDLTLTNSGEYTRTYTGVLEKTNTIGAVKVYAVANPSTEMWNDLSGLQAAAANGEAEFKKALYSVSQEFVEPLGTSITLIGMAGSDGSANIASDGSLGTRIILKRPYASVAFNFNNGAPAASDTERAGHTVSFTPTSYDIYNIPLNSALFEGAEVVGLNHFDRVDQQFGTLTPNSFSFYMIENIQEAKQEVTTYHDRDEKDSAGAFVNAPEEGTYVRVYGKYVENDENGKVVLQGDVNYTIHLGDFSGGDNNQYSVKRNYKYTYNVTINGVEQIIVEATAEDDTNQKYQHGAEGYIINTEGVEMVYNLDAHYEDALIGINTTSFDKEGHGFILRVSTPYMTDEAQNTILTWDDFEAMDEAAFKNTYDIDWIKFYPVTKTNERTPYPNKTNQSKLMNVYELYHELYKIADENDTTTSSLADYVNSEGMIYFMAFVDEYFYSANPLTGGSTNWTKFVNAKPRSMYMLQNPDSSTDGNSTYATVLCAFEQKSIQTMFKMDGSINAYGIEWYDETENARLATFSGGIDNANGYSNYFGNLADDSRWSTYVNESALRYGLDGQPNGNTYSALTSAKGEYACMQRNRDLDGNGSITDNERRWYLASSDQYVQMWIGETAIDRQARMSGVIKATTEDEYKALSHYYTSSDADHRIYWASEAGSVGSYGYNPSGNTWMGQYHKVRCVRTLNISDPSAEPAHIYDHPYGSQIITMSNLNSKAYRESGSMVGEYAAHNELAQYLNQIPHAIEVAESDFDGELTVEETLASGSTTVESAFFVRDTEGGGNATAGENPAQDVVLTFTKAGQKMVILPESIRDSGLTAGKSAVTITFDSFTATINGVDVTHSLQKTGFCSEQNSYPHYTTSGASVVVGSFSGKNSYTSMSKQIGIGFNVLADPKPYTISDSSPLVITITNLKVNGVNPVLGKGETMSTTYSGTYPASLVAESSNLCATLGDGWRVPNERELQVMGLEGYLESTYYDAKGTLCYYYYLSRTTFSAYPNVGLQRYLFAWQAGAQRLEMSAASTGKVRCVRDVAVTESTTAETDGTTAGSYSDKGNLTSAN